LEVDGKKYQLTSDGDGKISQQISVTAENGILRIASLGMEFPIRVGHLDPLEEETGWKSRLRNLGYLLYPHDSEDLRQMKYVIEEFQCDRDLPVTGNLDEQVKAKLQQIHGACANVKTHYGRPLSLLVTAMLW
jgi:hypothetical protein